MPLTPGLAVASPDMGGAEYRGLPALTAGTALTTWTLDPLAIALVILAAALYLGAVRRVRADGGHWASARSLAFVGGGLGSLLLATVGAVGAYAHTLFWIYTTQILVLLIVAPTFFAFGRPLSLAAAVLPASASQRLSAVRTSPPARVLASPVTAPVVLPVVISVVFFTGVLAATLHHHVLYELLHLALLAIGFGLALALVDEEAGTASIAIAVGIFLGFLEFTLDALPGIVVRLRTHLLAGGYYATVVRPWGPRPLHDQQAGGAILWFVGEAVDLPFLALLVLRWMRADEREAVGIDAEIDRAAISAPAGLPSTGDVPADAALLRPWWETTPGVFEERRAARFRSSAAEPSGDEGWPDARDLPPS
jgi:putative membrane protein